ncbi:NADH-quinone oxidoreductase subunit C [Streptomyces sp. BK79]|uniref:NADH-quinone oxidoreductase subunit C n=1 Tax=Streptomyces sp. BK79 TaxID=3350097 RepID=UPI0037705530
MTAVGWLPAGAGELFGTDATAEESYDVLTVDVPPGSWISALETARDRLGCTYFDWLSAVDEPGTGFRVAAHVVALGPVRRLLLRTTVPHEAPALPTAVAVYAGAAWHERETHEMFGVDFQDHPALDHLLLPEGFEGHPLRKDFVLAARVAKAWPGAKEPGESDHGGPRRRQMLPPGVPDPNEWGPLKGQLPPAPARPARGAGRPAGERPARRTRTAAEGSAGQTPPGGDAPVAPRRSRTAAEGSASQGAPAGQGPQAGEPSAAPPARRARSAGEGSASQRAAESGSAEPRPARRTRSASEGSASQRPASAPDTPTAAPGTPAGGDAGRSGRATEPEPKPAPSAPRSPDAPWHHARPAFDTPEPEPEPDSEPESRRDTEPRPEPTPDAEPQPRSEPQPQPEPGDHTDDAAPDTDTPGGRQ